MPALNSKPSKQASYIFAVIFALIALLGLISIMTPSQDVAPTADDTAMKTRVTYSGYLFRVVAVTLTLVVFLIVGLRVYRKQIQMGGKNNLKVNLLGRYYLNDKQYLLKVTIEDRNLLLGVSESNINLITELDQDLAEDDESNSFGHVLDLETNKATRV